MDIRETLFSTHNREGIALKSQYPETLNELLLFRGQLDCDEKFITYLADGDSREELLTFGSLLSKSKKIAHLLRNHGLLPGDRILLILPTGLTFIESFFGIQAAGMVPVPVYPPARLDRLEHYLQTLTGIIAKSKCRGAIIEKQLIALIQNRLSSSDSKILFFNKEDIEASTEEAELFQMTSASPAFLQFTSGTTSHPRGVLVLQKHLFAQLASYAETTGIIPGKVAVSWLPLYHDLGLIGMVLASLYAQIHLVLLSPLHFLKDPFCWIRAMSRYRATHTCAPNFGYALSVRKCPKQQLENENIDLSTLELMGMGGEAVLMSTIEAFREHFKSFGLNPDVMGPCYGLAENVLGATGHRKGEPTRSLTVSKKGLQEGLIRDPDNKEDQMILPSNGRAMPTVSVRIADEEGGNLGECKIGEIWIAGPSVTAGYFDDGEATREIFVEKEGERWLKTGDIGFLDHGDLYISGRKKDILIVRGKNYSPQDIEEVAGSIEGVRKGNIIAFALSTADSERAVLVCERDERIEVNEKKLRDNIQRAVNAALALNVEVVIIPKGAIPKTSSGKLQRSIVKMAYEKGALKSLSPPSHFMQMLHGIKLKLNKVIHSFTFQRLSPTTLNNNNEQAQQEPLDTEFEMAIKHIKPYFDLEIHSQLRLDTLGFDSLERMELWMAIEKLYKAKIPEEVWNSNQTLGEIQRNARLYKETGESNSSLKVGEESLTIQKLIESSKDIVPTIQNASKIAPAAFALMHAISKLCWNVQVEGIENLPKDEKGYILAGNHQSYLDGAWIRNALPANEQKRLIAISGEQLKQSTYLKSFLSLIETISLDADASFLHAIKGGISVLGKNRIVLVFPEGTRTHTGRINSFRPGVGLMSLLSGYPIVPFRIKGGFEIYPRHKFLPRFFMRRGKGEQGLTIVFGKPITPPKHELEQSQRQLNEMMQLLRSNVDKL